MNAHKILAYTISYIYKYFVNQSSKKWLDLRVDVSPKNYGVQHIFYTAYEWRMAFYEKF